MQEENKKFAWDTLDTTTLMIPIEIAVYHLYRFEKNKKKPEKSIADLQVIKSYVNEKTKDREVTECSMK